MARSNPVEQLLMHLKSGVATSPDLEQALGVSQSWMSRTLRHLIDEGRVLRLGITRGARYGLRREVQGIGSSWPLWRVDQEGAIQEVGTLYSLFGDEYYLELQRAAVEHRFAWGGISSGLPYFLQDQRPGGFLGRAVPLRYPELDLPQRVMDWSDDHYLRYLTQRGSDAVGDLILGRPALDHFLDLQRQRPIVAAPERETRYPQLADEVMQGGLPGSSAHGEHPKFTALLQDAEGPRHVLVKFSPPTDATVGQRWSDLLVAEHLAHEILRDAGVQAAASRIFRFNKRTFLEVDRFDRAGREGRMGVTSLLAIDASIYGVLDSWIASSLRLHRDQRIDAEVLERVRLISTFGELIANTDRHFGNLAFYDRYDGRFALAPIYDMLPMLFAPEHSQVVIRTFHPPEPVADTLAVWGRARELAETYWRRLVADGRISADFRAISSACLQAIEALPRTGAYASQIAPPT